MGGPESGCQCARAWYDVHAVSSWRQPRSLRARRGQADRDRRGTFVVTNQRAVFIGAKQTREWSWSKLLGFTHAAEAPWTAIAVSNRQKTSGVLYDTEHEDHVRFVLDLAVARS